MEIIYLLVALILSLTLHEFSHGLVSDWLGDGTAREQGRLSLNPLVHIDPFMTLLLPVFLILVGSPVVFGAAKPVPFKPWALRYGRWGAALVALAGPLTNLLLACFFALWLRFIPVSSVKLMITLISVNLGFFVFNMIPFPPLDGSRVLYAVAPYGLREVMDRIERAGLMAIAVFLFIGYPLISRYMAQLIGAIMRFLVPGIG